MRSAASDDRVSTKRRYQLAEAIDRHVLRLERADGEARRVVARVAGHEGQAVHQRKGMVGGIELREQVRHRDQHREAGTPTRAAVAGAELHAGAHDLRRGHAGVEQAEHRLRDDERDVVLQPVAQARLQMTDRIGVNTRAHEHVVTADVDLEAAGVVGPEVERAARHEVEARVVPVTGHEPGLDRALMQREAEMRAAVFDRVRRAVVPEDHHRERADLGEEAPAVSEFGERSGPNIVRGHGHLRRLQRGLRT